MATLLASILFYSGFPLLWAFNHLTLLFTQERVGTTVDPLGILNNLMILKRQRRVSPDQNTSRNTCRDPQGRELTAALTVERDSPHQALKLIREHTQERNLIAVVNVGGVFLHLAIWLNTRENTQERIRAVINVGRVLLGQTTWIFTREHTQGKNTLIKDLWFNIKKYMKVISMN